MDEPTRARLANLARHYGVSATRRPSLTTARPAAVDNHW
jgi:hypothetical protein